MVSSIARPDLAFETCQLSSIANHSIGDGFIKANKVLRKSQNKNMTIKLGFPGNIENFKIAYYNDTSRKS